MSRKHWLATYGDKIPCEINPDAHGSVLEMLEPRCSATPSVPHSTVSATC